MIAIQSSYAQFFDLKGDPLTNGSVYFGAINQNPQTNPVPVYWDSAGTQPAAQPLKTINGVIARDGTPAQVFIADDYSISVYDPNKNLVYSLPVSNNEAFSLNSSVIIDTQIDAQAASIANGVNFVATSGMITAGDGGAEIYQSVPNTGTLQPWQFQSNGGSRRWQVNPMTVNLEQFGSVVYGQDIYPALQAALNYANAIGFCTIIIPPGYYLLSHLASITFTSANHGIVIKGHGSDATFIEVLAGATGGISLVHAALNGFTNLTSFQGFTLCTQALISGTALQSIRPFSGVTHHSQFYLNDVKVIGPLNGPGISQAQCFLTGLDISGQLQPLVIGFDFTGPYTITDNFADDDLIYTPNFGIVMDGTYGGVVFNCKVFCCKTGLSNVWTTSPGGEGVRIIHCNFVQVKIGINYVRVGSIGGVPVQGEPTNLWFGNHVNYRDVGMVLSSSQYINVSDNIIYCQNGGNQAGGVSVDIQLYNFSNVNLRDNMHCYGATGTRYAVQVQTGGLLSARLKVVRPSLPGNTEITNLLYIDGTPSNPPQIEIVEPELDANSIAGGVVGGPGAQHVTVRYGLTVSPLQAWLQTAAQSIPNNATTVVLFTTVNSTNTVLTYNTTTGAVTVNAGSGVRYIKIKCNITWTANTTGAREVFLFKNGASDTIGAGPAYVVGMAVIHTHLLSTGWMACVDGDSFTINVLQTSGGALNVINGQSTWIEADVK